MNFKPQWFIGFSALLSDIVFMFCGYALFTTLKSDGLMEIGFLPWVGIILIMYVINNILVSRSVKENTYMTVNIIFGIVLAVSGSIFFVDYDSIVSFLFAVFFIAVSSIRCYSIPKNSVKANQMLVYVEFSIMVLCFVLVVEKNIQEIKGVMSLKFLASTTFDLISLMLIRVSGQNNKKYTGEKFRGLFFIGSIVIVAGTFALGFLLILSDTFTKYMYMVVQAAFNIVFFIKDKILEFFIFLFSKLPGMEQGSVEVPVGQGAAAVGQMEDTVLNYNKLLIFIGIVIAILIINFVIKIYRENKNKKLNHNLLPVNSKEVSEKPSLLYGIKLFFKNSYEKTVFFIKSVKYRNTPEGIYLEVIKYGNAHKIKKQESESVRCFIKRISDNFGEEDKVLLFEFMDCIDTRFYSVQDIAIEKSKLNRLRKIFK